MKLNESLQILNKLSESYGAKENTLNHDAGYLIDEKRCKEYLEALKNILVYNSDQYRAHIANLDKGGECDITIDYYMLVALCKLYEKRIKELESENINESSLNESDERNLDYRRHELNKIGLKDGNYKLKVISASGETKWLDITEDEFAEIERILTSN